MNDLNDIKNMLNEIIIDEDKKKEILKKFNKEGIIATDDEGIYIDVKDALENRDFSLKIRYDNDFYYIEIS